MKNTVYRSSKFQHLHLIILIILSFALLAYSFKNWPWSVLWVDIGTLKTPIALFGLPFLIAVVVFLTRSFNSKLILTDDYILFIEGIMSWRQNSTRMEYESIKEVSIEENLFQRIFGIGDIICQTGPNSGQRLARMVGVAKPRIVKDVIMQRIPKATQSKAG